jgi:hypothetical protein
MWGPCRQYARLPATAVIRTVALHRAVSSGGCASSFQQRFDVPGEQRFEVFDGARLGELLEQVEQVGVGLEPIDLGTSDQGVQVGTRSGTLLGFCEEPRTTLMDTLL